MPRHDAKYAVVYSGGSVSSGFVALKGADLFGLWAPALSSGSNIFVKAAFAPVDTDPASADFVRLQNAAGSGDWTGGPAGANPGSRAYTLQDVAFPFTHFKAETSVAQTDVRTFVFIAKFRSGAA